MEPHSMNENGKRVSSSPEMENGVKRSRATLPENYNNAEYVHALERRVALLEQVCAGLKQEMAAMRHVFASHVEKCSNNHPLQEQRLVSKPTHVAPLVTNVETITIDHPAETVAEPRGSNSTVERLSSPPSPNGTTRNPHPTPYNSGSHIIHQPRIQHSEREMPHLQLSRQGSSSLPINIPSHSPTPVHPLRHTPPQNRVSQTLRPTSLPQTLTVSPIQIPSPTPTRAMHSSNPQATLRHSQPALNQIKVEFPPFKPALPYVIDEDITIEKELDAKKKHASPLIYDVDDSAPASGATSTSPDEVMFVGARPGANLPHSRYHCQTVNKFSYPNRYEDVPLDKPLGNNALYCQNCFCYVCDVKCSECKFWTTSEDGAAHCNAYSSPIWKQLRAVHRNPLFMELHKLYHEKNPIQTRKYIDSELASDVTNAIDTATMEPRASELSSALEFYHDLSRKPRPCVCDCHTLDVDNETEEEGCYKCDMFHDLNRPGWITIQTIMDRRADEIRSYLSGEDLTSLSASSYGPQGTRKLARATVNLDSLTERVSTASWRRPDADPTAENMFKATVRRLCLYWVEVLLDPEFTPKLRSIATARLKRMADGAAEPAFKEQMQLAISIGGKGWEHEELQKIASGQPPTNAVDDVLLMPILRSLYKSKQWDKLSVFLKNTSQRGALGSSHLLPLAMARVGQYHEAVNWCMQHMASIRFNLLLDVGTIISEAEGPNNVIVCASFRMGLLALHKALRKEYAPTTKPEIACWLIRTLSGRGLTPAQLAERNAPGAPTQLLQAVRQTATRIFTFEEQRILGVLRSAPEGGAHVGLAAQLGVGEPLVAHLMLEISLLLCIGTLDVFEIGRIADVLKKNDDMFGILSLAFHMPQDQEPIMNFVVANVFPTMGTASAPNLVEKWITNPNISDFLLVQFVALFIKEGNHDRAFAIGERIVSTHKAKSTATRFSTYCAMTKLAELLWPLAIGAGRLELAKTLAQATFDEAPSWKNMELLEKSYGDEWPSRREQLLSLIRTGQAPYVAIPSVRRLELLARSGRFADAAAVLQETSASSPEEAAIIGEVVRDLKQNSPEKVEEFAKSILAWLETMTFRGYADEIWLLLVPALPQFCINQITKFLEQLEESFDRKTVQENDRRLMVNILLLLRRIYIEASNEAAWNNRLRRLISGPLRRKSALMTSIKATALLFDRFPARNGEMPIGATSQLPSLVSSSGGLNTSLTNLSSSLTSLNSSLTSLNTSATGLNTSATGLNNSATGLNTSATGLNTSATGLGAAPASAPAHPGLNASAGPISVSGNNMLRASSAAINISGSGGGTRPTPALSSASTQAPLSTSSTASTSPPSSSLGSSFGGRLTPVAVSAPLTISPQGRAAPSQQVQTQHTQRPQPHQTSQHPQSSQSQHTRSPHLHAQPPPQSLSPQPTSHTTQAPHSPNKLLQLQQQTQQLQKIQQQAQQLSPSRTPMQPQILTHTPPPATTPSPHSHHPLPRHLSPSSAHPHPRHAYSTPTPLPLSPSRSPSSPTHPSPPLHALHARAHSPTHDKNLDIHLFQHFVGQLPNTTGQPTNSITLPPPTPPAPAPIAPPVKIPNLDLSQNGNAPNQASTTPPKSRDPASSHDTT